MGLIDLHIDTKRRSTRGVNSKTQGRDLPELPKGSRRQMNSNITDSPTRERTRQSRRSSTNKQSNLKDSSDGSNDSLMQLDGSEGENNLPEIPRKARRKKTKDKENSSSGSSSKLRSKAQQPSDPNLEYESPSSKSRNKPKSIEENEQYERGTSIIS